MSGINSGTAALILNMGFIEVGTIESAIAKNLHHVSSQTAYAFGI